MLWTPIYCVKTGKAPFTSPKNPLNFHDIIYVVVAAINGEPTPDALVKLRPACQFDEPHYPGEDKPLCPLKIVEGCFWRRASQPDFILTGNDGDNCSVKRIVNFLAAACEKYSRHQAKLEGAVSNFYSCLAVLVIPSPIKSCMSKVTISTSFAQRPWLASWSRVIFFSCLVFCYWIIEYASIL